MERVRKYSVLVLIGLIALSSFFAFSVPLSFADASSSTTTTQAQTFSVNHETYASIYLNENIKSTFLNMTFAFYVVSSSTYNNSALFSSSLPDSNELVSVPVKTSGYELTALTGASPISGTASIKINETQISVASPPQLIRVILIQNGTAQTVWAGYINTTSTVSGFGYVDARAGGSFLLQYADDLSIKNYSIPLSPGETSLSTSVSNIAKMNSTVFISSSTTTSLGLRFPKRYFPPSSQINLNSDLKLASILNLSISLSIKSSGYEPTTAYYKGAVLPAIRWTIDGSSSISSASVSALMPFNATTLGMYGVNGTEVGYNQMFFGVASITTNSTIGAATAMIKEDFLISSNDLVVANGAAFAMGSQASSTVILNNATVLVFLSSNGQVESTANLTFFRQVYVNGNGALIWLQVNSTSHLVAIFSDNASGVVNYATPSTVVNATYAINETTYKAQQVSVNYSGYSLFNVTLNGDSSGITVYKQTSSGNVALNSKDYFASNGTLTIFDDPSSTYFVVYPTVVPSGNFLVSPLGFVSIIVVIVVVLAVVLVAVVIVMRRRRGTAQPGASTPVTTGSPSTAQL